MNLKEQLEAVKQNGYIIECIEDPCLEVQLEAVKRFGLTIRFIKNPCLEVQLEAVKQNGKAIYYLKNTCPEVQKIYFLSCLSNNEEIYYNCIKDLRSYLDAEHDRL